MGWENGTFIPPPTPAPGAEPSVVGIADKDASVGINPTDDAPLAPPVAGSEPGKATQ